MSAILQNMDRKPDRLANLNRRDFILGAAGFFLLFPTLDGCGGSPAISGLQGGGTSVRLKGAVQLPAGVKPNGVTVVSGLDQSSISSGSFSLNAPGGFPTLASVIDNASMQVMFFGMLDPSASSQLLDATNCAISLLFVALGGSQLPPNGRSPMFASLGKAIATAQLASVIKTRLNVDNFALLNGDSAIKTALSAAVSSLAPSYRRKLADTPDGSIRRTLTTPPAPTFTVLGDVLEGSFQAPFTVSGSSEQVIAVNSTLRETHLSVFM